MNLRFEKNQIRIRLSQKEALACLDNIELFEDFPFSAALDPIQIHIAKKDMYNFTIDKNRLLLSLNQNSLENWVKNPSKEALHTFSVFMHGRQMKVYIEIDIFKEKSQE